MNSTKHITIVAYCKQANTINDFPTCRLVVYRKHGIPQ